MDYSYSTNMPIVSDTSVADVTNSAAINVFNVTDYGKQLTNILDRQSYVNDIINTENDRLNSKEKSIDDALYNKQRLIDLNYSYTKRNEAYTRLIIIFIIMLASLLFLNIIEQRIAVIPTIIISALSSVIVFTGIYNIIYIYYYDIYMRNNMNYDELNLKEPTISNDSSTDTTSASIASAGVDASSSPNSCYNSACCSTGTKWDDNLQICVSE